MTRTAAMLECIAQASSATHNEDEQRLAGECGQQLPRLRRRGAGHGRVDQKMQGQEHQAEANHGPAEIASERYACCCGT